MILVLSTVALAVGVDRVPEDFPTIQAALDQGTAPTVLVGPGTWDGATLTRSVHLVGQGAVIVKGVRTAGERAAFLAPDSGSDSVIEGFVVDCASSRRLDLGVLGSAGRTGSVAAGLHVRDNDFLGCVQGVTNAGAQVRGCTDPVAGGAWWVIENNRFHGLPTHSDRGIEGGGVGVLVFNAEGADITGNQFTGTVQDTRTFATAGVSLAGCVDCTVAGNTFAVDGAEHWFTAVHNAGARMQGAAASRNLLLVQNEADDRSYPWLDVAFTSRGSVDTQLLDNTGVAYVDHATCGDGDLRVELPDPRVVASSDAE